MPCAVGERPTCDGAISPSLPILAPLFKSSFRSRLPALHRCPLSIASSHGFSDLILLSMVPFFTSRDGSHTFDAACDVGDPYVWAPSAASAHSLAFHPSFRSYLAVLFSRQRRISSLCLTLLPIGPIFTSSDGCQLIVAVCDVGGPYVSAQSAASAHSSAVAKFLILQFAPLHEERLEGLRARTAPLPVRTARLSRTSEPFRLLLSTRRDSKVFVRARLGRREYPQRSSRLGAHELRRRVHCSRWA